MVLLSLVAFCAFSVSAADVCNDTIFDEGNYLSDNAGQVQKAAQALIRNGADVRVRLLASVPQGTLDFWKADMLKGCRSWQSPDGGMKNNLIVVVVAPTKGKTGIYYGDLWRGKLGGKEVLIQTDSMNPRFREKNWAVGVSAGLGDIADFTSVKIAAQAGGGTTINHAVDLAGLWKVLRWVVLAVIVALVLWLFWWLYSQLEARRSAQRDAQTKRGECSGIINSFSNDVALATAKANQIADPEWKEAALEHLRQANAQYGDAVRMFSGLDRSANNPDAPGLSVDEYRNMETRYQGVYETLHQAAAALQRARSATDQAKSGQPFRSKPTSIKTPAAPPAEKHQPRTAPVDDRPTVPNHHQTPTAASTVRMGGSGGSDSLKQRARQKASEAVGDVTGLIESVERLISDWFGCPTTFRQQLGTFREERDGLNRRLGEFDLSEITLNAIRQEADTLGNRVRRLRDDVESRKGDGEADSSLFYRGGQNGGLHHHDGDVNIIAPVIISERDERRDEGHGRESGWDRSDIEETPAARPFIADDIEPAGNSDGNGAETDFGVTSDGDGVETSWETGSTQY
jgi:uncharacterized membrane protein YgcG